MTLRTNIRKISFGLSTILNIKPMGYFLPYRYAKNAQPFDYPSVKSIFDLNRDLFISYFNELSKYKKDILSIQKSSKHVEPRWEQSWFPRLDALMAYYFVRKFKPKKIIEIGSGHSTRFLLKAMNDEGLNTSLICIDPEPRANFKTQENIDWVGSCLQDVNASIFNDLHESDIIFIDSSHLLMPGTDVDYFWSVIFPAVPKGCLIHIHDIYLPYKYPKVWQWRNYNEQVILPPLLLSDVLSPLFSSAYFNQLCNKNISNSFVADIPIQKEALETSLWVRKNV